MTPFGEAVRRLRARKGVSQKEMAAALNVSPAYLSALEHGKRGLPTFDLLQRIAGYFNIIWDEAEELFLLARTSDPRVVIDTSGCRRNIPNSPTGWPGESASLTAPRSPGYPLFSKMAPKATEKRHNPLIYALFGGLAIGNRAQKTYI